MPRNYSVLPWKKGFKKLPADIEAALAKVPANGNFIVGCAKVLTEAEIQSGVYRHLYIEAPSDIPSKIETFIPSSTVGRASFYNATLLERADKTRGKYEKTIHGRAPTRGRFSFHRTSYRRPVWHQTLIVPSMMHIGFKRIEEGISRNGILVRFQIQEVLTKVEPDCHVPLLRCLNLLQENVGKVDLFPVDADETTFIRRASEDIGWEVIPDAKRADILGALKRKLGMRQPALSRKAQDRLDFIDSLAPKRIMHSTRGYVGYFAVEFTDNLTIFENLELDHAMFVVRTGVKEFSRLTRTQLREHLGTGVERIVHTKGWQERLATMVKQARGDQSGSPGDLI